MDASKGTTRREFVTAAAGTAAVAALGFNRTAQAAHHESALVTQMVTLTMKEGQEEAAAKAFADLAKEVKANEPGVLAYAANVSQKDPSKLVIFEVYANEEALKNHSGQPHMQKAFATFGQVFDMSKGLDIVKMDRVAGFTRES
jgi:quinol monooxygenase YgiN